MADGLDVILADLGAEYERLDAMLAPLGPDAWRLPSLAPGWSIGDVVLHLALTEEAVVRSVAEQGGAVAGSLDSPSHLEDRMADDVRAEATEGPAAFARWRAAAAASRQALATADPDCPLRWVEAPLKPRTLATTRLAEHWAHGLDMAPALGVAYADTVRLRHIAWLGHATLPYAFRLGGLDPAPVAVELSGPQGEIWTFGPSDAASRITGPAGDFCRVGARRLKPEESRLAATGPAGADALRLLRNWA